MPQAALTAIVSGRVQMVMYRDFVRRKAKSLGVVGEVANLPDGTVRVTVEGEKQKLDALLALIKKGPLLAEVAEVAVEWKEPSGAFESFSIRYS